MLVIPNLKRDIAEIFGEFTDQIDREYFWEETKIFRTNAYAYQAGCSGVNAPHIRQEEYIRAAAMLESGLYSARAVSKDVGWSINTVCALMHRLNKYKEIKCPCGQPIVTHRGWCSYRFENSEKRQEFIKQWTRKN